MNPLKELWQRLLLGRWWIVAQFGGLLLALLIGLGWTRIPEKHAWQVLLSLLLPVLLVAGLLALQAATMRRFSSEEKRASLAEGALSLLAWLLVGWLAWTILDWCGEQSWDWASWLNAKAPAAWRARFLSYEHLLRWIGIVIWLLRWVVVPGKIIPCAVASALGGWRMPWRRAMRVLFNWRWWPAPLAAAILAIWLPGHWFSLAPHGTVRAQQWGVGLKLVGTYVLAVVCWLLLLAWSAVLLKRQPEPAESALDWQIWLRIRGAGRWVVGLLDRILHHRASPKQSREE